MNTLVKDSSQNLHPNPNVSAPYKVTVSSTSVALDASITLDSATTHIYVNFSGADAYVDFTGGTAASTRASAVFADGSHGIWSADLFTGTTALRTASTDVSVYITELCF